MTLLMLHNIRALSGLMLVRLLENESCKIIFLKCCLKNTAEMSAAAKFRQLGLVSCLMGFVFFLFSGLFVCFVSNTQIYLPFSCRCQRGFEIPFFICLL